MTQKSKGLHMPVFPKLTEKQLNCLRFLYKFYQEKLYYPSRREIADEMGISAPSANQHVEYLIQKGYLVRVVGESRNIRLNPDADVALKHLGIIQEEGGDDEQV